MNGSAWLELSELSQIGLVHGDAPKPVGNMFFRWHTPPDGQEMAYLQNRVVMVNQMRIASLLLRLCGSNLNRQVELISKNSLVLAFSESNEMNVGINAEMNVEMK